MCLRFCKIFSAVGSADFVRRFLSCSSGYPSSDTPGEIFFRLEKFYPLVVNQRAVRLHEKLHVVSLQIFPRVINQSFQIFPPVKHGLSAMKQKFRVLGSVLLKERRQFVDQLEKNFFGQSLGGLVALAAINAIQVADRRKFQDYLHDVT